MVFSWQCQTRVAGTRQPTGKKVLYHQGNACKHEWIKRNYVMRCACNDPVE